MSGIKINGANVKIAQLAGLTYEELATLVVDVHRHMWPERHMTREQADDDGFDTTETGTGNTDWCSQWSADTPEAIGEIVKCDMLGKSNAS